MARKKTADEWRSILREFESSGMTHKAFCNEYGIARSTLGWWKKRLRSTTHKTNGLVKLERAVPAIDTAARISVVVDGRVTVEVRPGVGEEELRRVLGVVRSVWCS